MKEKFKDLLFPYEDIRPIQEDLIEEVDNAIKKGANLIAHAPTGLGKTIASLAPAISFAKDKDLTIFFLK